MLFENPDHVMDKSNVLFLPDVREITDDEYKDLQDEFSELAA